MRAPWLTPLFASTLIFGTLLTLTSSHWLLAWMGLEISSFAMLPLMAHNRHPRAVEATTKYFMVQATSAALLLFTTATNAWLTGQWNIQETTHPAIMVTIILALGLKLGLAPMHAWLPEVLQGTNLVTALLISTWQKIAPFVLLTMIQGSYSELLIVLGLLSALMGGWGGLNQTQLRKILGYSSTAHLGWMVLVMQYSSHLAYFAMLIYLIATTAMFTSCTLANATSFHGMANAKTKLPQVTVTMSLVLLSLGGLPPLTGFAPKWMVLLELTKQNLALLAATVALAALLSLLFYIRIIYAMASSLLPQSTTTPSSWRFPKMRPSSLLSLSTSLTTLLFPLTPTMITIISYTIQ